MSDPQRGTLSNDELIAKLRWTKSKQFVARHHPRLRLRLRLRAKPRLLSGFDRSPRLASSAPGLFGLPGHPSLPSHPSHPGLLSPPIVVFCRWILVVG